MLLTTRRRLSLVAMLALALGFSASSHPAQAADDLCFPETNQCIAGRFRQYWEQNGGLAVFGFPVTPARDERNADTGKTYLTQWFERNRFEAHPENGAPYDVLLGRLGDDRLGRLGRDWRQEGRERGPQAGCLWFEQTGHNVCNEGAAPAFRQYWETHGLQDPRLDAYQRSLALFGLPLTASRMETNSSGDRVLTQWFERARFEWHPNNAAEFRVLLGRLGDEVVRAPGGGEPASGRIVYVSSEDIFTPGDLYIMNADGSGQSQLTSTRMIPLEGAEYAVSPAGDRIAYRAYNALIVMRLDAPDSPRVVVATSEGEGPFPPILYSPVWAPDGSYVAFLWKNDIYASKADGSPAARITETADISAPACISWARNGYLTFRTPAMHTFKLWVVRSDGSDLRQIGWGLCGALSPSGDRMSYLNGNQLWLVNFDGTNPRVLAGGRPFIPGQWSPDGTRLLTVGMNSNNSYDQDIYVIDVATGTEQRLTNHPDLDAMPAWSPDGAFITFASKRTQRYGVYVMRADGSGQTLLATPKESAAPRWTLR